MRTYKLDLETLRSLLEELGQSGRLSAILPSGIPGLKERCQARIELQNGKITFCSINTLEGLVRVSGNSALQVLFRLGPLEWDFLEIQLDTSSHGSMSLTSARNTLPSRIPRRVAYLGASSALSRQQRRVMNLVDGTRDVEKIALLLFPTAGIQAIQFVEEMLQELETLGLITMNT